MNRLQKSLAILVLVQAVLVLGMSLNPSAPPQNKASSMLNLSADDVVRLTIKASDVDKQGTQTLEFQKTGGRWVLPSADNFEVDAKKVHQVIEKLTNINVETPVARSAANHNTLNVGERNYSKSVSIGTADQVIDIIIGEAKGRSMYVRRADQADVYLAKGVTAFDISEELTTYTDPEYFSVTDIKDVVIERPAAGPQARAHFYQNEEGQWLVDGLDGVAIDQSRVRAVLASVRSARMVRPVGKSVRPEFGLGKPQARVTVKGKPESIEFLVGNTLNDFVYLKASNKEDVVLVRKYTVDSILNLDTKNLIDKTPAKAPSANSAMPSAAPSFKPAQP